MKTIFITGVSSGIGESLAYVYAREKYTVGICARRINTLNKIADKCEEFGGRIFAYKLDVLLGINMVPLTSFVQYSGHRLGSQQYFVRDSVRARVLLPFLGRPPTKFDCAAGRSERLANMNLFDWLINNLDRNVDNYLILPSGRHVLIDHGFSFRVPVFFKPSSTQLKTMIPSSDVILKLRGLAEDPSIISRDFTPLLGKRHTKVLIKKIKYMSQQIDILKRDTSMETFFNKANEQLNILEEAT